MLNENNLTERQIKRRIEMLSLMHTFADTARRLTMSVVDGPTDEQLEDIFAEKYPFTDSFDEMALKIMEWNANFYLKFKQ